MPKNKDGEYKPFNGKQMPAWMFKEYHEGQKEGARKAKISRKIDKAVKKVTSK